MFYGEYFHIIDKKNRIILPARFKAPIKDFGIEKLYITRGLDKCLFMFPDNEWAVQEAKFKAMPFTKREVRKFKRMFFSGACDVIPDKQWRILVPDYLLKYANIKKDVVIIGVSNRIEMWDKNEWEKFYAVSKEDYEDVAERLIES